MSDDVRNSNEEDDVTVPRPPSMELENDPETFVGEEIEDSWLDAEGSDES